MAVWMAEMTGLSLVELWVMRKVDNWAVRKVNLSAAQWARSSVGQLGVNSVEWRASLTAVMWGLLTVVLTEMQRAEDSVSLKAEWWVCRWAVS